MPKKFSKISPTPEYILLSFQPRHVWFFPVCLHYCRRRFSSGDVKFWVWKKFEPQISKPLVQKITVFCAILTFFSSCAILFVCAISSQELAADSRIHTSLTNKHVIVWSRKYHVTFLVIVGDYQMPKILSQNAKMGENVKDVIFIEFWGFDSRGPNFSAWYFLGFGLQSATDR